MSVHSRKIFYMKSAVGEKDLYLWTNIIQQEVNRILFFYIKNVIISYDIRQIKIYIYAGSGKCSLYLWLIIKKTGHNLKARNNVRIIVWRLSSLFAFRLFGSLPAP